MHQLMSLFLAACLACAAPLAAAAQLPRTIAAIKPGGVLLGHDYQPAFPGLIRAVHELFKAPDDRRGTVWKVTKSGPGRIRKGRK